MVMMVVMPPAVSIVMIPIIRVIKRIGVIEFVRIVIERMITWIS
jgi:hypothetical protein